MTQMWDHHDDHDRGVDIVGYGVEARDGSIGKIDAASYAAGSSYIVVDTGAWIFGKKVLLPAGVIASVDHEEQTVSVFRSKDEIKDAPEYEEKEDPTESDLALFGTYYGRFAGE